MEKLVLNDADRKQLNWVIAYLTSFLIIAIGFKFYGSEFLFRYGYVASIFNENIWQWKALWYISSMAAASLFTGLFYSIRGFLYSAFMPILFIFFIRITEEFLGYTLYANYKGGGVPGIIEFVVLCIIIPCIIFVWTFINAHFLFSKIMKHKDVLFYSVRFSSLLMGIVALAYLFLLWSPSLMVQDFFIQYADLINRILSCVLIAGISSVVLYCCYILKIAE